MKLIKQVKLSFREGNSDKVYEIDLCEAGADKYLVNFRFGRRGANLSEGTKTVNPVDLAQAEKVFNALETEKRKKGYSTDTGVELPSFQEANVQAKAPNEKAILNRLAAEASGTTLTLKTVWDISRVVWRAGELRLQAALPYLLKIEALWSTQKNKEIELYTLLWALGRLKMPETARVLLVYFGNEKNSYKIRRIAGEGLFHILTGEEKAKHVQTYLNRLPEDLKKHIEQGQWEQLNAAVRAKVLQQKQKEYSFLTSLYSLSLEYPQLKQSVVSMLQQLKLAAPYFRSIRHIFKLAEFREDAEVLGLMGYRFDGEKSAFQIRRKRYWESPADYEKHTTYDYATRSYIQPLQELKKSDSKLAYSSSTKDYLLRRSVRILRKAGKAEDLNYVRMATAILCNYDKQKDYMKGYVENKWPRWNRWNRISVEHPEYYHRYFLNYILYGNRESLKWTGTTWWIETPENKRPPKGERLAQPRKSDRNDYQGIAQNWLKKVSDLFKRKPDTSATAPSTKKDHPFAHLWEQLPQAFVQLLVRAKIDEIHAFALMNLKNHPQCAEIEAKMDAKLIGLFLQSGFDIPTQYGMGLAEAKLMAGDKEASNLIITLTNSHLAQAREMGMKWMQQDLATYFQDTDFIKSLLFSPHEEVRTWAIAQLGTMRLHIEKEQALVGRCMVEFLSAFAKEDKTTHLKIQQIATFLYQSYPNSLKQLSTNLAYQLLSCENSAVQAIAAQLFILQKDVISPAQHSEAIYLGLFLSDSDFTRQTGVALFGELSDEEILAKESILISLCLSQYSDVRQAVRPIVKRLAAKYPVFGKQMVDSFVPLLMRKANYEGFHEDLATLLIDALAPALGSIDKATALNLLYANYTPAQEFGVVLLNEYISPNDLTIRQVIAAGSHEILAARTWAWRFFTNHLARIKEEKGEAIRLLDAKWDDSREFAKQFFTENFGAEDWNPEVLIAIVDSVKPEVQNFGKALVTKFFEEKEGETYLLKLSQHPTASIQIFATNYLERFASGDLEKLKSLEHYFRAVLMRVNKARVAKERVLTLLETESIRNEEFATYIASILSEISATAAIEDKARCIDILRKIGILYPSIPLPLKFVQVEIR